MVKKSSILITGRVMGQKFITFKYRKESIDCHV